MILALVHQPFLSTSDGLHNSCVPSARPDLQQLWYGHLAAHQCTTAPHHELNFRSMLTELGGIGTGGAGHELKGRRAL